MQYGLPSYSGPMICAGYCAVDKKPTAGRRTTVGPITSRSSRPGLTVLAPSAERGRYAEFA